MNDQQQLAAAERMGGLIFKYLSETITDDELAELHNWAYSNDNNRELFEEIIHSTAFQESIKYVTGIDRDAAFRDIQDQIRNAENESRIVRLSVKRRRYFIAAASMLMLVAGTAVIYLGINGKTDNTPLQTTQTYKNDAAPGGYKAILTLANGNTIVLDKAGNGPLTKQGNIKVIKLASGQLAYSGASQSMEPTISYNILSTPRGGQYFVELIDGTKVWLNAASSIRFPVAFTGDTRSVEITGEAYFEVAKDKTKAFFVKTTGVEVQVLGTSFDINSYTDEPTIKTSLVEGSVKIYANKSKQNGVILEPGQQAQVAQSNIDNNVGRIRILKDADISQAVSWLKGKFVFHSESIDEIMKQLARWYDLEVVYEGPKPDIQLSGSVSRNVSLSSVLKVIEISGVNCKIEGKKIIVLK